MGERSRSPVAAALTATRRRARRQSAPVDPGPKAWSNVPRRERGRRRSTPPLTARYRAAASPGARAQDAPHPARGAVHLPLGGPHLGHPRRSPGRILTRRDAARVRAPHDPPPRTGSHWRNHDVPVIDVELENSPIPGAHPRARRRAARAGAPRRRCWERPDVGRSGPGRSRRRDLRASRRVGLDARAQRADLLSGALRQRGEGALEARRLYREQGEIKSLDAKLTREERVRGAIAQAPRAKETLGPALAARDAAVDAEATVHDGETYGRAERGLQRRTRSRARQGRMPR